MRLLILAAAVLLLLLQVLAAGAARTEALVGGWTPIKNLSDPYVREIAEFAVKTHNSEANTGLVLNKVVKGETQVVAGTNYRLIVEVKDGADAKSFEALVWDKPWEHVRRLSSFKAVQGNEGAPSFRLGNEGAPPFRQGNEGAPSFRPTWELLLTILSSVILQFQ